MPLLYFQRAKRDHYFVNRVNSREDAQRIMNSTFILKGRH